MSIAISETEYREYLALKAAIPLSIAGGVLRATPATETLKYKPRAKTILKADRAAAARKLAEHLGRKFLAFTEL